MADSFNIKQHDTYPNLVAVLKENGVAVDLTDAEEIQLVFKGTRLPTTVIDAEAGQVLYDWSVGDTDEAGTYDAEFEVTWPQGVQTFPNNTYFKIVILADLG